MINNRKIIPIILHKLLLLIYTQLVVTLFSLPILVSWGLPISTVVLLSNIIFVPFFTVFIVLCTLIFFSEILLISNGTLFVVFNESVYFLDSMLKMSNKSWLFAFPSPGNAISFLMIVLTLFVLYKTSRKEILQKTVILCCLLISYLSFLYFAPFFRKNPQIIEKSYSIKQISPYNVVFIDNGFFSRKRNIEKAVIFGILPKIYKTFGKAKIVVFCAKKPSKKMFDVVEELKKYIKIEEVTFR